MRLLLNIYIYNIDYNSYILEDMCQKIIKKEVSKELFIHVLETICLAGLVLSC